MRSKIVLLVFLLFTTTLFAYQDYDIDGVEDSKDRCPNTPFDKLVDSFGCPQDYYGIVTLKIGSDISSDDEYAQSNNLNFFINYRYNRWNLSISNANYTVFDSTNTNNDIGDIYLSGGYLFKAGKLSTKINLGIKLATSQNEVETDLTTTTGENDYFTSVNFNYLLQKRQNIFLYYGYTLSGDSDEVNYENTYSYSIGSGYSITNRWYSAISYEISSSMYEDTDSHTAVSWFNSYSFSKSFFTTVNYAYALSELSYDSTISLKLGMSFR